MTDHIFRLPGTLPIENVSAGCCISKGIGKHVTRVIDSYEIIYVKSGVLGIYEEDTSYEVGPGQALILFPGRRHGGTRNFDKDLIFYWLHFRITDTDVAVTDLVSVYQFISIKHTDRFLELLRDYIKCYQENWANEQQGSLILMQIFMEFYHSQMNNFKYSAGEVLAIKAQNFISQHIEEDLTVKKIAAALNCNSDYLGKIYLASFHKTIIKSIQELRIRKSSHMLLEGDCNINEIAEACGYQNADQFRKIFRQFHGESPKEYRKKYSIIEEIS